jgi:secreted Zn-dependent insulinase-like peptidase
MKLVVVGKDSLDQLELWATQMFSSVVNKDVEVPDLG